MKVNILGSTARRTAIGVADLLLILLVGYLPVAGGQQLYTQTHAYQLITQPTTWLDAKTDAETREFCGVQGHLVTITWIHEDDFVFQEFLGQTNISRIWIGYNDIASEGSFEWVTGEISTYSNWNETEPNNEGGSQHCGEIVREDPALHFRSGAWNDQWCDARQAYVVEYDCVWFYNGHAYQVIQQETAWEEARVDAETHEYCGVNGHLVTITSEEEDDFVNDLLKTGFGSGYQVWMGFNDIETESEWVWVTGENSTYSNWRPTEPSNTGGVEHCGELAAPGWNDVRCDKNYFYMVEYDCPLLESSSVTPSAGPTPAPTSKKPTPTPVTVVPSSSNTLIPSAAPMIGAPTLIPTRSPFLDSAETQDPASPVPNVPLPGAMENPKTSSNNNAGIIVGGIIGGLAIVCFTIIIVKYFAWTSSRSDNNLSSLQNISNLQDNSNQVNNNHPDDDHRDPSGMGADDVVISSPAVAVATQVSSVSGPTFKDQTRDNRGPEDVLWADAHP